VRHYPFVEGHPVAYYRLYFLDENGHIRHVKELACDTDSAAIALSDKHADGRALELWERERLVWRKDRASS
jgi:hypothetical protein